MYFTNGSDCLALYTKYELLLMVVCSPLMVSAITTFQLLLHAANIQFIHKFIHYTTFGNITYMTKTTKLMIYLTKTCILAVSTHQTFKF